MEINDLTPAEARVWRAFPRGEAVDFRTAADDDPALGDAWGPERTVRAEVLRALLLTAPRVEGEVGGLKLAGARITGVLDLRYATVDASVRLSDSHFGDVPNLYGARLRQLNLTGSVLPGLTSATVHVEGVLRMTRCRFRGPVRLGGAKIAGALFADRAEFASPDGTEPALQLNHAVVEDDLSAPGMRARGEVRLNGARITGSVDLNEARFDRPDGTALNAETLGAGAEVLLRNGEVHGRLELRGARIAGRLDLSHSRLRNPGGTALRASSCVIGELWLRQGPAVQGTLNLRRSQIEVLFCEPEVLPREVRLSDLTYTSLIPHEPAGRRLPMLEQADGAYLPFAYEQLTQSYRRVGDDDAARLVQLAKQRRHRRTLPWYARAWGHLQDATVGYGFRPLRACGWLLSLLAVGSVVYGLRHPPALKPAESPEFNPVFYTLDLLLPVISFGQENAFAPQGWYQTLAYALVITGWILATTVVAGVTRTVSRQ
ncbi:hypothetical protein GCM10010377_01080 [Streptomyces viridiviolaceus]|uniref:Membrane-associated oxidoreductase n=1 Tax=Streptomyces viridiviolaceus TaxID=68282 RepID=A0ABW2E0Q1_9ACTN|nr:membrane-associated oxidoreductase [Streptomyces viridiviolaceus]GHB15568.1 hypothetical protein GCM10010377_01080 [Streptomyces viridiviolaceus]